MDLRMGHMVEVTGAIQKAQPPQEGGLLCLAAGIEDV